MLILALLGALGSVSAMAQTNVYSVNAVSHVNLSAPAPGFQEVYQIISSNLAGANAIEMNRAAVDGLLCQLGPRIGIVQKGETPSNAAEPLAPTRLFDKSFAYFRVASVNARLPEAFHAAYRQLTETNSGKIKGLILDLRFAGGDDYAAAAKLADCFLSSDHLLLDWQSGSAHATIKADAVTLPLAVLVNAETSGASEALAAVLRDNDVGLMLGGQTAGQANIFKEFPLSNGSRLRVAVGAVSFGAGKTLAGGVTPDILVNTSADDERAYLNSPYKILHSLPLAAQTELSRREAQAAPRLNEVELIREHRTGEDADQNTIRAMPDPAASAPVVADPALARALDLLKGLAVVEPHRPG